MSTDFVESKDLNLYLPDNHRARTAVERARAKVKQNNEMVEQIKAQSNVYVNEKAENVFNEAQNFQIEGVHNFELNKIRTEHIVKDFIKGVFGIH